MINFTDSGDNHNQLAIDIYKALSGKDRPTHISVNETVFSTGLLSKALKIASCPSTAHLITEVVTAIITYDQLGRPINDPLLNSDGEKLKVPALSLSWTDGTRAIIRADAVAEARKAHEVAKAEMKANQKKADKEERKRLREQAKVESDNKKAELKARKEAKKAELKAQKDALVRLKESKASSRGSKVLPLKTRSNYRERWK